jgi:hypothetical protein
MKIKEVTQTADAALYEEIDANNDTGVSTDDLVKLVNTEKSSNWTRFNDFFEYLDMLDSSDTDSK